MTALLSCLLLLAALVGDGHAADCPHHAPAAPGTAAAHGGHAAHRATAMANGAHAAHGATTATGHMAAGNGDGASGAAHHAPHGGSDDEDACTCIGACHAGATVLHTTGARPVLLAQTAAAEAAIVRYQEALRGRTPYLIPFGTSPPL